MQATPKSSGERYIEQIMQQIPPESERYHLLASAKRFKSSWVELGERLLKVNNTGVFVDWGYGSFEEYCSKEIRIRRQTAQKLTMAYRFMKNQEPALLARSGEVRPLPDYRSVDLLRQAREDHQFPEDDYGRLRQTIIEDERSHPTVQKQFREIVQRETDHSDPTVVCKVALSAARRLATSLAQVAGLPGEHRHNLDNLIVVLEGQVAVAMSDDC